MDRRLFLRLRDVRRAAYRAAALIDAPANRLNRKSPWPPIWMRREVGPLNVFESSAAATLAYLQVSCGLTPTSRLLDMGCGCGAVPLQFMLYAAPYEGSYHGIDVDRRMIAWCERHLAGDRFRFSRLDYWSATYNPAGERFLPFPVEDGWADVLLMKSVLTHLLPDDTAHYLRETARVLTPTGTAALTAVLYDRPSDLGDRFPHDGGHYRYMREDSPESSIALQRAWVDEATSDAGLRYTHIPGAIQGTLLVRRADH